jgi:hypothetical protein
MLQLDLRHDARRCGFCHDTLEDSLACRGCAVALHPECWGEVEACPTLGCAVVQQTPSLVRRPAAGATATPSASVLPYTRYREENHRLALSSGRGERLAATFGSGLGAAGVGFVAYFGMWALLSPFFGACPPAFAPLAILAGLGWVVYYTQLSAVMAYDALRIMFPSLPAGQLQAPESSTFDLSEAAWVSPLAVLVGLEIFTSCLWVKVSKLLNRASSGPKAGGALV